MLGFTSFNPTYLFKVLPMVLNNGYFGIAIKPGPLGLNDLNRRRVRNFVIVYGDPGLGSHFLGILPRRAAVTHEREVRTNTFINLERTPLFKSSDNTILHHISTVQDLIRTISIGNVVYLSLFGHGWNPADGQGGAIFIGQSQRADTNLSNRSGATNTPVTSIPRDKFIKNIAQVRLFACRSGYGSKSIAAQLSAHLQLPVFGYDNPNGSIFTNDPDVGHGILEYRKSSNKSVSPKKPLWLVPNDGSPKFTKFQ